MTCSKTISHDLEVDKFSQGTYSPLITSSAIKGDMDAEVIDMLKMHNGLTDVK